MVDYKAVLDDLDAKRKALNARFDAAEAAIRQVLAMEVQPILPGMAQVRPEPREAPLDGPYSGLTMGDAAVQHLAKNPSRPVPNTELAKALEEGGFKHKSRNFPNTLNSVLRRRSMALGDLRKGPKGWMLSQP